MSKTISHKERQYWQTMWVCARRNMPRVHADRMGSPKVLRTLLGYKTNPTRNSSGVDVSQAHGQHVRTATDNGSKPRNPQAARLLEMLAGPHGTTIVRAIAIQRGLDLTPYKVWP